MNKPGLTPTQVGISAAFLPVPSKATQHSHQEQALLYSQGKSKTCRKTAGRLPVEEV